MSIVRENHWTEQRLCGHPTSTHVRHVLSTGGYQVVRVCADCGKRQGTAEPFIEHPNRESYPELERHPYPCECHPAEAKLAMLAADLPEPSSEPGRASLDGSYQAYLESEEWAVRRRYYVTRAFHRCQLCNKRGGPDGRGLNVHHRTYHRVGHELDIDVIVLCRDCHARHHGHIGEHRGAA